MIQKRTTSVAGSPLRILLVGVAVVATLATGAGVATAAPRQQQVCDENGENCHPPAEGDIHARCSLSNTDVTAGETVVGHIEGVPDGAQVTVTFEGTPVGQGTASAQAGQSSASADIPFSVPSDAKPGQNTVTFSGAGFTCSVSVQVTAVLGENVTSGGGPLARTGVQIAVLVAVALVLLVVGAQLRAASRNRKRREEAARLAAIRRRETPFVS